MAKLNYVEMPSSDVAVSQAFYGTAFDWQFTPYGPDYAAVEGGAVDIGFNATSDDPIERILPVIEVANIELARSNVIGAGGLISRDIFAFPGGRRFHFHDPDGNELGVYVKEG
ncbi:VOC family protein [soil metagenome]